MKKAQEYILAIDQGTTSSRAILFDFKGEIITIAQKEFKQIYPKSGWVEHNPLEILSTQKEVIDEVFKTSNIKPKQIKSIGITNQRETVVVWDKTTGEPIYNAIVWQDTRTSSFCNEIKNNFELKNYINSNTGLIVDSYFSASKIKWILEHTSGYDIDNLLVGTIDTWLLWNLTNKKVHATDYSNASRTMLFNIRTLKWDSRLTDFFEIPNNILPEVKNSSDEFGFYEREGVKIPIGGVAGDQQAALFGQACFNPGQAKNTYGTGCFMLMNTGNEIKPSSNGLLTTIAWGIDNKVTYALEGSVFIAGAAIQWLRDELMIIEDARLSQEMANKATGDDIYVVPAFVGLGAPHWDETARGAVFGLTRGSNRNDLVKGTLRSLGYQAKDIFDLMEKESGISLAVLAVDGGASQNDYLMQFQSDILNKKIKRPQNHETTAKGAAYLAGLYAGFWTQDDLVKMNQSGTQYNPQMEKLEREKLYAKWLKAVNLSKGWLRD